VTARPAAELAIAVAAAGASTAFFTQLIESSRFDARSRVAAGVGVPWAAGMLGLAAAAHVVQRRSGRADRSRWIVALLAGLATGLVMAPLTAGLNGTDQPPNTILAGDMAFHTEYVTRFASTWRLEDYAFRGLHAFYPPAWFWLAGRTAHVLELVPWRIVKPFTIATIGAALLTAYALWRAVLTPAGALSAAIGSSLVLPTLAAHPAPAWYSPYSCFVAVSGAAWLAATQDAVRRERSAVRLGLLTLVGTALALLYHLLFLLLVVMLIALAAGPRAARRRTLLRLAAVVGGVALLSAVFWVPLVASVASGSVAQGHYMRPDFLVVATGLDGPPALAVLGVAAAAMIATGSAAPAGRAIAALLAGTVLYQVASVTALVFVHDQLEPHRAITMLWATLGAAVPVALDGLHRPDGVRWLSAPALRAVAGAAVALAVPAMLVLGTAQGANLAAGPLTLVAHTRRLPLARTLAISRFITQTTGKQPQQLTVVSADYALVITQPYYSFLPLTPSSAHPAADVPSRVAVLRAAAACPTARCTTRTLTRSPFGPIDALVLWHLHARYRIGTWLDGFPDPIYHLVKFSPGRFSANAWARRDFGRQVVLVRRRPGR
jgi:galactan 5-O-arabinofuranosyltransferase